MQGNVTVLQKAQERHDRCATDAEERSGRRQEYIAECRSLQVDDSAI